jgi:hypothetical protein
MLRLGIEALLGGLECEKGVRLGACVVRSMFVVSQAGGSSGEFPLVPTAERYLAEPQAHHLRLCSKAVATLFAISFFSSYAHLSLSHQHPCHSSHLTAHPAHGYTRSQTVALASSNFSHSVTALRDYGFDQVLEVSVSAQCHLATGHLCF